MDAPQSEQHKRRRQQSCCARVVFRLCTVCTACVRVCARAQNVVSPDGVFSVLCTLCVCAFAECVHAQKQCATRHGQTRQRQSSLCVNRKNFFCRGVCWRKRNFVTQNAQRKDFLAAHKKKVLMRVCAHRKVATLHTGNLATFDRFCAGENRRLFARGKRAKIGNFGPRRVF